jgi:dihydroorotate dehydrogenase
MLSLTTRLLHLFPPEQAHHLAIKSLRHITCSSVLKDLDLSRLSFSRDALTFPHPIGLAAGFDKHAEVFDQMGRLGFSWVEVGSVTPTPQKGNIKPRVFRLKEDMAIINRYGFNSYGMEEVRKNLLKHKKTCMLGVNLGKNKNSDLSSWVDFILGAQYLQHQADYITINISSPNTQGLRDMQHADLLQQMIYDIRQVIPPEQNLWVKLAPDMDRTTEKNVVDSLCDCDIQALVLSNTSVQRPDHLISQHAHEQGGLSGYPLAFYAESMLKRVTQITRGRLTIIASGGIMTGDDVYHRIRLGAHAVQIYTAMIYHGPQILRNMLERLLFLMDRDGVNHLKDIHH